MVLKGYRRREHLRNHRRQRQTAGAPVARTIVRAALHFLKKGMRGVYQHCAEKHLHRYLAEFDFRYSERVALGVDDVTRTAKALGGAAGKRLTYRPLATN